MNRVIGHPKPGKFSSFAFAEPLSFTPSVLCLKSRIEKLRTTEEPRC